MSITETPPATARVDHVHWLDNLRSFIVFLVVLIHAGGVYESSGIWGSFWIVDDPSTNNLSGILFLVIDIFAMPTLFFLSGFLAPQSVKRRGGRAFLMAKFRRLMVPWVLAVLTLIPVYKAIFLYSRDLPQEHWSTYFHWSNGIWSQNWLWFLPILFLFNVLYLTLASVRIRGPRISLTAAVLGAFFVGLFHSVAMETFGLQGWTKTFLLDFQNERLLTYFLSFLLGARCFGLKTLETKPRGRALYITVNAVAWFPVTLYIVFLLYPWLRPGQTIFSGTADRMIVWIAYYMSLLCLMYLVIQTFRRCQDKSGWLRNCVNKNSYGVYIVHVIFVGAFALPLLGVAIPSFLKHVALTAAAFLGSNLAVLLFRLTRAHLRPPENDNESKGGDLAEPRTRNGIALV